MSNTNETPAPAGKRYLTPEDVIAQGPFGRTFIYASLRSGALKATKVGKKRYVILPEDVHAWLTASTTPTGLLEGHATGPGTGRTGRG
jgi:hypothetical protein